MNFIISTNIYYFTRKIFAHAWNPTLTTFKSIMLNFPTHFNTLKICFSYKAKEKSTEKLSSSLLASISQYRGRGRLTAKLLYICFGACVYKYITMCVWVTLRYFTPSPTTFQIWAFKWHIGNTNNNPYDKIQYKL